MRNMEFERLVCARLQRAVGRRLPDTCALHARQKVLKVEHVGPAGGKADVQLHLESGDLLGVSVKQRNATFIANAIGRTTALRTFRREGTLARLGAVGSALAEARDQRDQRVGFDKRDHRQPRPFHSAAASFALRKSGRMSARIDRWCCPHDLARLWTGVHDDPQQRAHALILSCPDELPQHVDDVLDHLLKIDHRMMDLCPTYVVFRPNFVDRARRVGAPWVSRNKYGLWTCTL